jgi:tetratricopeptide (TPR) repeat protein
MFPYLWRSDRNPFDHLQANEGIEFDPPGANFISYQARTGGTVDYVAAIGFDSSPNQAHPNARAFLAQIAAGYSAVFRSSDGRATLYRAKAPAPPADRSAAMLLNYSLALYQTRRFTESIEVAKQVLAIEPASDRAYNNICASHNAMEQWDQAIVACNAAIKLNPANQIAKNNLAWANSRR